MLAVDVCRLEDEVEQRPCEERFYFLGRTRERYGSESHGAEILPSRPRLTVPGHASRRGARVSSPHMNSGTSDPGKSKQPAYWTYIRVEDLLSLQGGLDADEKSLTNDEVLFITVHQVFELWFKLMLREMVVLRDLFRVQVDEQRLSGAVRGARRIATILRRCVDHFEVIETLTTREYLEFRDKLTGASGFQSAQMRQLEILMGLEESSRISLGAGENYMQALREADGSDSPALSRVLMQLDDRPSLREVIDDWLFRTPIDGSSPDDSRDPENVASFVEEYLAAHAGEIDTACRFALERTAKGFDKEAVTARYEQEKQSLRAFLCPEESEGGERRRRIRVATLFIITYRELPLLAWPRELLDGLAEMEQFFLVFRQRHARMVERMIGKRTGTGGSSGVDYLDKTALAYRVFQDLWAVRTFQIRKEAAPELRNESFYDFRYG